MKSKSFKAKLITAVSLSLLIVGLITYYTFEKDTFIFLNNFNFGFLPLIFGIMVVVWIIDSLKIKILAAALKIKLKTWHLIKISIIGKLFANITPSGLGSQPFKIYALRKEGIKTGEASAIVIVELFLRMTFFLLSLPIVLYMIHKLVAVDVNIKLLYTGIILFVIFFAAILYFILKEPRKMKIFLANIIDNRFFKRFISTKRIKKWKRKIFRHITVFHETLWIFITSNVYDLILAFFVCIAYWIARFTVLFFIIKAFGINVHIANILMLQLLIHTIDVIIPLPGGTGIEVVLGSLLKNFMPFAAIGITILLWRIFTFYVDILIGSILLARFINKDKKLLSKFLSSEDDEINQQL